MRNFFHALERRRVRYLLISGQASVLYGRFASVITRRFAARRVGQSLRPCLRFACHTCHTLFVNETGAGTETLPYSISRRRQRAQVLLALRYFFQNQPQRIPAVRFADDGIHVAGEGGVAA